MRIIDNLPDVLELLQDQCCTYNFELGLVGNPVANRYPYAMVKIDDAVQWQGHVEKEILQFNDIRIDQSSIVTIEYQGKTDNDTVVHDGIIVENQFLVIESIKINDIRLQCQDIANMGRVCYDLTPSQQQSYSKNGAPWIDVSTHILYNNGVYTLEIKKPILSNMIAYKQVFTQVFDVSHADTLSRLQQPYLGV